MAECRIPPMRKLLKLWYIWLTIPPLVGLIASAILIFGDGDCVNRENFEKIRLGMTQDEVDSVLGSCTIPIVGKRECGAICCNGDVFPYYSDHIEVWFGKGRTVTEKKLERAPVWHKIQLIFLPSENTSPTAWAVKQRSR
jgi:hypothetical protein